MPHLNEPRLDVDEPNNNVDIDNNIETSTESEEDTSSSTEQISLFRRYNDNRVSSMRGGEYIYYYHPRDLIELENNSIYQKKRNGRHRYENEVLKKQALRLTSSSNAIFSINVYIVTFLVAGLAMMR